MAGNLTRLTLRQDDVLLTTTQLARYEQWVSGTGRDSVAFDVDLEQDVAESDTSYQRRVCLETEYGSDCVRLKFFVKKFLEGRSAKAGEKFRFVLVDDGDPHFVMSNYARLFHVVSQRSLRPRSVSNRKVVSVLKRQKRDAYEFYIRDHQPLNDRRVYSHLGLLEHFTDKDGKTVLGQRQCRFVIYYHNQLMRMVWNRQDLQEAGMSEKDIDLVLIGRWVTDNNSAAGITLRNEMTGEVTSFDTKKAAADHLGVNRCTFRYKVSHPKVDAAGDPYVVIRDDVYYIVENLRPRFERDRAEREVNGNAEKVFVAPSLSVDFPAIARVIEQL